MNAYLSTPCIIVDLNDVEIEVACSAWVQGIGKGRSRAVGVRM